MILAQNAEIQVLRERVDKQDELILKQDDLVSKLNDKIGVLTGAIETLKKSQGDQEQYSRRYCLRISGIKQDQSETADNCVNKVLKVCKDLNVDVVKKDIDRAHRIGEERKTMIVKFHSFTIKTSVYRKRNKQGPVKVYLDLTKTRIQTLDKCRSLLNENSNVKFVFADITVIMYGGENEK